MNEKVRKFLCDEQVLADLILLDEGVQSFRKAMESGLRGEEGLMMIPTYITIGEKIPRGQKSIVLDAGGTNFRVATLYFDEDYNPVIENFAAYKMPGIDEDLSREAFFDQIVDYLEPVVDQADRIGFCFSYPAEMYPDRDGRVINFSKEIQLPEVIGAKIGENILRQLEKRGLKHDHQISILNDTVAALLGGRTHTERFGYDSNVGFILGTGTNSAYIEEISNIEKILDQNLGRAHNGYMAINLESGNFVANHLAPLDDEIDAATSEPGTYRFEKMISGRYQGMQALHLIRTAIKKSEIFSDFFAERFDHIETLSSKDLDDFLYMPYGSNILSQCCANVIDRESLYWILDNIYERAARLVCINLAAIMEHANIGKSPVRPVAITADGTTFYKSKLFRPKLNYYVRTYINDQLGRYCEFMKVEHANLIGAAIAALTN